MRFTFDCTSAARFPANMVSAAETHMAQTQSWLAAKTVSKIRSRRANAAALGPEESSAVTGVGAPS